MNCSFSEEYNLTNKTGSYLYHTYAEKIPIIDYHCHLEAREIYENKEFQDLGQMWLAHDHYKWRAMRIFGIDEYYITGAADYWDKFMKFAEILPRLIGNPLYIWCALELKRYFDIEEPLGSDNAEEIYNLTKERIAKWHITPRWCMESSRVEIAVTTEDPTDMLQYHKWMNQETFKTKILAAFRPDKAFYCEKETFTNYIHNLEQVAQRKINSFADMMQVMEKRIVYFAEFGTTVSDNGIADIVWVEYTMREVEEIFAKALHTGALTDTEISQYKSAFLIEMAKLYHKYHFVMQLHVGTYLDANKKKVRILGQSTGYDCVDDTTSVKSIGAILNTLTESDQLPNTILYPLNAAQIESFAILAAGFCDGEVKGKVQLGAPWWFNDQAYGIERQFRATGSLYPVSVSVGMLTDSRSFLSYPRHELFRRMLCSYMGTMIEWGEYFSDERYLKEMIEAVCYGNAKEFFHFSTSAGSFDIQK